MKTRMIRYCIILFLFLSSGSFAQLKEPETDALYEQQLEGLLETEETTTDETEDDYIEQILNVYKKNPLNINEADETSLIEFQLLNILQIKNLLWYRKLLGELISIYELQAVPGFSIETIKKIFPYITTEKKTGLKEGLNERLRNGAQSLLTRLSFIPEPSKGFKTSDSSSANKFLGSRPRLFMRYKYQYKNLLQFGLLGDKDAGEQFFSRGRPYGFDFYSFHLFIRKWKNIRLLAVGDFTVNLGQGLIHWQSQAFNKSAAAINIKRQSESLRPYHSAGEYNFHRGVAAVIGKGNWESLVFASARNISGNISASSEVIPQPVISSVLTSGLHRTTTELEDKGNLRLITYGGNIKFRKAGWHTALNFVQYHYTIPLQKRAAPYNLYAIKGKDWFNGSVDYSYTFRNLHVFGELATDKNGNMAMVNGLMASIDKIVDIALFHRLIGKAYQSVYGNAFTENSMPSNEKGVYMGMSITPFAGWSIDLYSDFFSFPWLKYRVNAPGYGKQFLVQLNWKPNKKVEAYTRYRFKSKSLNYTLPEEDLARAAVIIDEPPGQNWRSQISFQVSRSVVLKNRIELCWIRKPDDSNTETGALMFADIAFKPVDRFYSGSLRLQYFETGGYDSRLYVYENDLLYSSSIPSYFDSGIRYYINLKNNIRIKWLKGIQAQWGIKVSQTLYRNKAAIGTGPDEIAGHKKSDVRIQLILSMD